MWQVITPDFVANQTLAPGVLASCCWWAAQLSIYATDKRKRGRGSQGRGVLQGSSAWRGEAETLLDLTHDRHSTPTLTL